jgi:uroporphyrinogen-III synthase
MCSAAAAAEPSTCVEGGRFVAGRLPDDLCDGGRAPEAGLAVSAFAGGGIVTSPSGTPAWAGAGIIVTASEESGGWDPLAADVDGAPSGTAGVKPVRTSSAPAIAVSSTSSDGRAGAVGLSADPQAGQKACPGDAGAPQPGHTAEFGTESRGNLPARLCRRRDGAHKKVFEAGTLISVVVSEHRPVWRVAVVREESSGGPLATALQRRGLIPVACPVLVAGPAADPGLLAEAAGGLARYDWVIAASARAVEALRLALRTPWPAGTRAAAVGRATGAALQGLGVSSPVVVASESGADALWNALAGQDRWPGRRVLVLTTPGGRTMLAEALRGAGAEVEPVEAYRMEPRPAAEIRRDWDAADADALAIGSPRAVSTLIEAIGLDAVSRLAATVAIGGTTAAALRALGVPAQVPLHASFESVAETMSQLFQARPAAASRGPS